MFIALAKLDHEGDSSFDLIECAKKYKTLSEQGD